MTSRNRTARPGMANEMVELGRSTVIVLAIVMAAAVVFGAKHIHSVATTDPALIVE